MKAKSKKKIVRVSIPLSETEARAIASAVFLSIAHAGVPPKRIERPLVAACDRIMEAFGLGLTVDDDGCVDAVRG